MAGGFTGDILLIQYSGLIAYQVGLRQQQQSFQLVQDNGRPVLLGCEHYPVITLGHRARGEAELMASLSEFKDRGIEICQTDRGGQATLHSPGQLVIYPIIPIRDYQIGVREYVECLQNTTIETLKLLKVQAFATAESGVFTDKGKLAFVGIRVEKGITRHGLSLNVSNNLELFQMIRSCGVTNRPIDALSEQGVYLDPKEVFDLWAQVFITELIGLREQVMHRKNHEDSH